MNLAFIVLVILALVALWFLLSFAFKPVGSFFYRLWKDAKDKISKDDMEEKQNEQKR